jgi:hypothetical protein
MEQRRYPRIQLPLLVELKHPSLGTRRCIARDISEGGVYVHTDKPQMKPGAKVKVTLENALGVEAQPTPTVDMEVVRVEDAGVALAFTGSAGRHLWQSVERIRTELAIGRDYFQVHLNVLVINPANAILLAQQHGRWSFPAMFLVVGQDWQRSLQEYLAKELGVEVSGFGPIVEMQSAGSAEVPEAAVLKLYVEARSAGNGCRVASGGRYRAAKWVGRRRDLGESTFADERTRQIADATLAQLAREQEGEGSQP